MKEYLKRNSDKETMLERLSQLETNVNELSRFKKQYQLTEIKKDLQKQWILRYGLFESIQIVVDIACHLTARYNLGHPQNYSQCLELLVKHGYLSDSLGDKLSGMAGLRNLLIHEYVEIDIEQLHACLDRLNDFVLFADEIKDLI